MRFDCGLSRAAKCAASREWHPWFAWFPVRVGRHDCRWWETVERRNEYQYVAAYSWEYRERADG